MGELFQYREVRPWLRPNFTWNLSEGGREEKRALEVIHGFTDQVIADRKKHLESMSALPEDQDEEDGGKKVKKPLLDLMLEVQRQDSNAISDEGLRDEINTFVFAGHDTISVALGFCLNHLGNHPQILAKVHAELDSVFGTDTTRPVSNTDLPKLKYLEWCLKESLRLTPSAPLVGRQVVKPFELDSKTVVPVGMVVYLFIYSIHRNPKYFSRPTEFIPERFDPNNEQWAREMKRNAFAYVPFSAGARNCIGQRMALLKAKILLATILRRFTVKPEKKSEELELLSELVLRVKGGVKLRLESRIPQK